MPSIRSIYGTGKVDEEFEGVGKRGEAEELRLSVSISRKCTGRAAEWYESYVNGSGQTIGSWRG